jgi:hypothetical protein
MQGLVDFLGPVGRDRLLCVLHSIRLLERLGNLFVVEKDLEEVRYLNATAVMET